MVYGPVIRERFRQPRFRGEVAAPDAVFEDVNPLCGDRIRITCRFDGRRIAEARHTGDSCAIAMAAADVLLERVVGQPIDVARSVELAEVLERLAADIRPTRMKCAALPLEVLRGALAPREVAP